MRQEDAIPQGDVVVVELFNMENGIDSCRNNNSVDSSIDNDDENDEKERKDTKEKDEEISGDVLLADLSIPSMDRLVVENTSCTKQDKKDVDPIVVPTSSLFSTITSRLLFPATTKFSTWDLLVQPMIRTLSTNKAEEEENNRINPMFVQNEESSTSITNILPEEDCPLILTQTKRFAVFSIKEDEETMDGTDEEEESYIGFLLFLVFGFFPRFVSSVPCK